MRISYNYQNSLTSVFLFSTAGMRLLPGEIQSNIYQEIYKRYCSDKYKFSLNLNQLKTIGGKQEAFFGWITANYLVLHYYYLYKAGRFNLKLERLGNSIGSLDLGGYSTQIIFEPKVSPLHIVDL